MWARLVPASVMSPSNLPTPFVQKMWALKGLPRVLMVSVQTWLPDRKGQEHRGVLGCIRR
jgi:hypothetical protein